LLDAHAEAVLVAWTCATPPDDRKRWTMQLLADKLVELGEVAAASDETVRRALKKTSSSPGKSKNGVSPRDAARLCGACKTLLELYQEQDDAAYPVLGRALPTSP